MTLIVNQINGGKERIYDRQQHCQEGIRCQPGQKRRNKEFEGDHGARKGRVRNCHGQEQGDLGNLIDCFRVRLEWMCVKISKR